ncbi:hypothetical protein PBY51_008736 [Eleginops maclovinus]|uniref:Uncharacterized protein n=1 Tax=Eleginops maclovinus TaxID=56733 RepID=A0AAN7WT09_ELEMC|nr:hypothetical protein PBY51_008736 [Eleginops maclovinus]
MNRGRRRSPFQRNRWSRERVRRRRAGKDKGRLVSLQQENLAGRQRVSEPGNATKSHSSPSSSAPHLSGRHAITVFVYMGMCTTGNVEQNKE